MKGTFAGQELIDPTVFLDNVGSALSDLGSAISNAAGSVLDYLIPSDESFVGFANRKVEQWLLDGTAARVAWRSPSADPVRGNLLQSGRRYCSSSKPTK